MLTTPTPTPTWIPTHRITFHPAGGAPPRITEVYLVEGVAYSRQEWEAESAADWEVVDGEWRWQGQVAPSPGTVSVVEVTPTPTRDAAIAALVQGDVARWGEGERAAAERAHSGRTIGRALNELANRAELAGAPDPALRAAADAALSSEDWDALRDGG